MIVAVAEVRYLVSLASVSPGQEEKLPAQMDINHVDRTSYPDATWK